MRQPVPRPATSWSARITGRRSVLAGGALAFVAPALVGCGHRPADVAASGTDPDLGVLADVVGALDATSALVLATATRHPRLAPGLVPVGDLHAAHRTVLLAAATSSETALADEEPTPPSVAARAGRALGDVRSAESALAERLREAAVTAQDGPLARALASMAAGLTQAVLVLPSALPGGATA